MTSDESSDSQTESDGDLDISNEIKIWKKITAKNKKEKLIRAKKLEKINNIFN